MTLQEVLTEVAESAWSLLTEDDLRELAEEGASGEGVSEDESLELFARIPS